MLRRRRASSHPLDAKLTSDLLRLLNFEAERLGLAAQDPGDDEAISARARYRPMVRLLSEDDSLWLDSQGYCDIGRFVRRSHRRSYRAYLKQLTREVRSSRKQMRRLMKATKQWNGLAAFLRTALFSETVLLYLRWQFWKHALGFDVSAAAVRRAIRLLTARPVNSEAF